MAKFKKVMFVIKGAEKAFCLTLDTLLIINIMIELITQKVI